MRYLTGIGALFGVTGALAASMSCRQVVGIEKDPPMDLSRTACGIEYGGTACASCVSTSCCAPSTACSGDSTCRAHFMCLGACPVGDSQCRSQCLLDHPVGAAPGYAPLTACVARSCNAECGLACGGLDYFAPPDTAAGCQACLGNVDCTAELACASAVDCVAYAQCMHLCATPDCRLACSMTADGGLTAADAGAAAIRAPYESTIDPTGACNVACAVGGNWTCLGHVDWPIGTTAATTLTSRVLEAFSSSTPVAEAGVSLCQLTSPCSSHPPIASGTSDMLGNVILGVPANPLGFPSDAYVQVTAPSGSIVPALYFLGYPVSRSLAPMAQPYLAVVTPADVPALAALVGADPSSLSTTGLANFEVFDCNGFAAVGVEVTMEPKASAPTVEFYATTGGTLSTALTMTSNGLGGFVAVPPGPVTLTATPRGLKQVSSRATILVQAGAEAVSFMFPSQ